MKYDSKRIWGLRVCVQKFCKCLDFEGFFQGMEKLYTYNITFAYTFLTFTR